MTHVFSTHRVQGTRLEASVDHTNVASLRCNPLLLNKLRLSAGGRSDKHVDISQFTFGFEESRFRIIEPMLNCANFVKKPFIIDVNHESIMGSA